MMISQKSEDETLDRGPWFQEEMKPEERRIVRNLVLATKNGELEEVREILESGKVDVDSKYHWETALMVAARLNNVALCELLLDYGASCNVSRIMQQTPLWIAASHGNAEVMELLTTSHDCSQENLDNALRKCVIMNFLQGCDILLRAGASPNATDEMGCTCLHVAAAGSVGSADIRRQDNWRFQNPESWRLYHATSFETCELLIMWKADVNAKADTNATPLHFACETDNEEICRLLIENGADVNSVGGAMPKTPLHAAISSDSPKIMRLLLQHDDIQLNMMDAEGETPLMAAIQLHKQESVRILLDDERWPELMSVVTLREVNDDAITTPMRELIRHMPEMACTVLNKCISINSEKDLKNPNFTARFNFAFLDDTYTSTFWNTMNRTTDTMTTFTENRPSAPRPAVTTTPISTLDRKVGYNLTKFQNGKDTTEAFKRKGTIVLENIPAKSKSNRAPPCDSRCFNCLGKMGCRIDKNAIAYTKQNRTLMNNHPLRIAIHEKRNAVLCHPVAIALINHKWKHIGRYWFYGGLILYLAFLVTLSAHITISFRHIQPTNSTGPEVQEEFYTTWKPIASVVLLGFAAIAIIKQFSMTLSDFPACLWKLENWLNAVVHATTIATVIDILQWDLSNQVMAAVCIFSAWFNMLLMLREFPVVGIFFIMFTRILKNSFIVLMVFTPLMVGFSLTFAIITPNLPQFASGMNFATVMVMLSGEVEYVDSLTAAAATGIPYKGAAISVYVIFTILMVICLLNLLVGLAVSDVETLHNQAKAEMMALKAEKVIACEYYLSEMPRKRIACGCMTVQPNKARFSFRKGGRKIKWKHRIVNWFSIFGFTHSYLSAVSIVKVTLQEKCDGTTENLSKEISHIKSQLELLVNVQRALKSERSTSIRTPELPGARILKKAFGLEKAPTSQRRLSPHKTVA